MNRKSRTEWSVIGRGLAGWHAMGISDGNRCSSSGGDLEGYLKEALTGALVYDASEADRDAFANWTIRGPMLDCSLAKGEVKMCFNRPILARMLPGLEGAFAAIGAIALLEAEGDSHIGSMDMVAQDLWLEMMRAKVPGIKVGWTANDKKVVWE